MRRSAAKRNKKTKSSSGRRRPPRQWEQNIKKTNGFSICLTKSIGIPYQSLGELTHTPALTKPKEIECDELWTASTDRSSTSLEDTAAGPCQTKPDLTESLRAVGKDNKVRDNLLPLEALHGEIVIPNKRAAPIYK